VEAIKSKHASICSLVISVLPSSNRNCSTPAHKHPDYPRPRKGLQEKNHPEREKKRQNWNQDAMENVQSP
jgi:hypothetical protein